MNSATSEENVLRGEKCYACGKPFRDPNNRQQAVLIDDGHRSVLVGPECYRKVIKGGDVGYKPPSGGPRLFYSQEQARRYVAIFPAACPTCGASHPIGCCAQDGHGG